MKKRETATQPNNGAPKRNRVRKWARFSAKFVFYSTALFIVIVLSTFLLLQTDTVREKAKRAVQWAAADKMGLRIEFDKMTGESGGLDMVVIFQPGIAVQTRVNPRQMVAFTIVLDCEFPVAGHVKSETGFGTAGGAVGSCSGV